MKNLSPFQKEEEIRKRLLDFFRFNKSGFTTTEIEKKTKISRKTLEKHLQLLVRENEIYMAQHGPTRVYYPYIYKIISSENMKYGDSIIWFDLIETDKGKFLNIKKKQHIKDKWLFQNAIRIPMEKINDFKKIINKF